jgi:hypothetical protein
MHSQFTHIKQREQEAAPTACRGMIARNGTGGWEEEQTFVSSISGETGGLSKSEPLPLRSLLLWESRPKVSVDTSCCSQTKQQTHQLQIQYPNQNAWAIINPIKKSTWFCAPTATQAPATIRLSSLLDESIAGRKPPKSEPAYPLMYLSMSGVDKRWIVKTKKQDNTSILYRY